MCQEVGRVSRASLRRVSVSPMRPQLLTEPWGMRICESLLPEADPAKRGNTSQTCSPSPGLGRAAKVPLGASGIGSLVGLSEGPGMCSGVLR